MLQFDNPSPMRKEFDVLQVSGVCRFDYFKWREDKYAWLLLTESGHPVQVLDIKGYCASNLEILGFVHDKYPTLD